MFRASRRFSRSASRRAGWRRIPAGLEILESRQLLASQPYVVSVTADSLAAGTLRSAILAANQDTGPGPFDVVFNIPASTAPDLNVPVAGFDPVTQTWQITLNSPLPTITHPISIDGFSEANNAIPYRYGDELISDVQTLTVLGAPTGGTFTLTTAAPLPVGTTAPLSIGATEAQVQAALEAIVGSGDVAVTGGNLPQDTLSITFGGVYVGESLPTMVANVSLLGGTNPSVDVETEAVGSISDPSEITSVPNTTNAIDGNNAQVRVILNGSQTGGATGLVLNSSQSTIRGLAIEGFGIGISIPEPTDVGDLIQGNFIGPYLAYPVDQDTGDPLPSPSTVILAGAGNSQEGILLDSANATVGGFNPDENNVISGNGAQGVLMMPGSSGNQILGNQIGVIGPSTNGLYFQFGNGGDGVAIESSGEASDPSGIVYSSSNVVGGAVAGSGNVISVNAGYGVHLSGVGATRNLVEANFIGVAPGGGYLFGTGNPGNTDDGVRLDDAPDNQIGGPVASDGNVISSNQGAGVYVTGADAAGNSIANNIIGLVSSGTAVLGNDSAGVADYSPGTMIGPGNVISDNQTGILISGASATEVIVRDNLIGTDSSGSGDLGNVEDGIQIVDASGNTIEGDNLGVQVISGNLVGIEIDGATSTANIIQGNLIGTNKSGTADRGNSNQGILIEGASGNTIGGTTAAARNVISANQWGIQIDGSTAERNLIEGNNVGTDISGQAPLGNEINGIILSNNASDNTIGGTGGGQGNLIAYNVQAGVLVQSGIGNSILSNSVYSNGQKGIAAS